jgi:hypothetical protein
MIRLAKKQIIRSDDGQPYLIRWAINTPLLGIKLHHILRSDEDRDLHDHPWSFLSVILWGGYWEHTAVIESKNCSYDIRIGGKPVTISQVVWRRLDPPAPRTITAPP